MYALVGIVVDINKNYLRSTFASSIKEFHEYNSFSCNQSHAPLGKNLRLIKSNNNLKKPK